VQNENGILVAHSIGGNVDKTFPSGMTVKDLKELLKDWPENDSSGKPCEVWIGANGASHQAHNVYALKKGGEVADMLLE
jgi:6-phosphogluconate dehydrogenase